MSLHHLQVSYLLTTMPTKMHALPRILLSVNISMMTQVALRASIRPSFLSCAQHISHPRSPLGRPFTTKIQAMKATWEGTVIAESDKTVVVENNHYFPPESIKKEYFQPSDTHTTCGWKGVASYYSVDVGDGKVNKDAAWYYPDPKPAAKEVAGYIAFWKGVKVSQ